jgi:hypothetical protein
VESGNNSTTKNEPIVLALAWRGGASATWEDRHQLDLLIPYITEATYGSNVFNRRIFGLFDYHFDNQAKARRRGMTSPDLDSKAQPKQ